MKLHPYCSIFPPMSGPEFDAFLDDIKANGMHNPVVTLGGEVLDGRNRLNACELLGIEPQLKEYEGTDPLGYVVSQNYRRRHLTQSQAAMVAAEIAKLQQGRKSATETAPSEKEAAEAMHVSTSSVQAAKRVRKKDAKLADEVKAGTVTLHAAEKQLKAQETPVEVVQISPPAPEVMKAFESLAAGGRAELKAMEDLAGGNFLAANTAPTIPRQPLQLTAEAVEDWMLTTNEGSAWRAEARHKFLCDFTATEANEWIATTTAGEQWLDEYKVGMAKEFAEKQPQRVTPALVTSWIVTPEGQAWLKDYNARHGGAAMKKVDKHEADIAAGRTVRIPTGPPFLLAHLQSALVILTAMIPSDAEHAKFADVLSTFAAKELQLVRKQSDRFSPYTS
jgi:hypothetical protein